MLTIVNTLSIKSKELSINGHDWLLYGIDTAAVTYTFIFIPIEAGRYDIQKPVYVMLNRYKDKGGMYKLHIRNSNSAETWVSNHQIGTLQELLHHIALHL
jgi:hypothetical protein